ncbi:MFS transporter [bacterium]|nr:MFS transporter [bacterium]
MLFKRLFPIMLLSFVNTIGFSLLIPVMPFVVEKYGLGATTYGLLISTYSLFQFLAAPALGKLSNIYGRKKLLIISQAGTLLSWFIFASAYFINPNVKVIGISLSIFIILLSRVTDGITGGNISVANAYVSDITEPHEKTKAFGLIGATFGLGFMFGPVLGSFSSTSNIGYLGTVILAILISTVALILLFKLKDTAILETKDNFSLFKTIYSRLNVFKNFFKYKKEPLIFNLLSSKFFFAAAFTAYTSIISLYLKNFQQLDPKQIGIVFTIIGSFLIINQGFLTPKISQKIGSVSSIILGQILLIIGFLMLPFVNTLVPFLAISYLINIGISLNLLNTKTILVNSTQKSEQAEVLGFDESFSSINSSYIPLISGAAFALFSNNVFVFNAVLAGVALYFGLVTLKISKKN